MHAYMHENSINRTSVCPGDLWRDLMQWSAHLPHGLHTIRPSHIHDHHTSTRALLQALARAASQIPASEYTVQGIAMMANALSELNKLGVRESDFEARVRQLVVSVPAGGWNPRALALVSNAFGWLSGPGDDRRSGGGGEGGGGREEGRCGGNGRFTHVGQNRCSAVTE